MRCTLTSRQGELTGAKHGESQSAKEGCSARSLPRASGSALRQRQEATTYTARALRSGGRLPAQPRDATLSWGEEEAEGAEPTPLNSTRQLKGSQGKERIRRGCSQRGLCEEGSTSSCPTQPEFPNFGGFLQSPAPAGADPPLLVGRPAASWPKPFTLAPG